MWPFNSGEDHFEEQLKVFEEMKTEKQAELDGLDGAEGNPTLDQHRKELEAELAEIEIRMEQTREQAEERGRDTDSYERTQGIFRD